MKKKPDVKQPFRNLHINSKYLETSSIVIAHSLWFFRSLYRKHGFFSVVQQSLVGQGFLIIEASRSHSDTPHPVGLLWTSDQPDAENSTWQHITFTRDRQHASGRIRTRNPSKRAAAGWHLKTGGHWCRLQKVEFIYKDTYICIFTRH